MTKIHAESSLLRPDGTFGYGHYVAPLREIDLDRAHVASVGLQLPPWLGRLRLKQWQHYALVDETVAVTFAVVDLGYLSTAWVQVVDRQRGERWEIERKSPRLRTQVARALWDEETWAEGPGLSIRVHNHLESSTHEIALEATGPAGRQISARVRLDAASASPLVVCLPVGRGRAMYSHKVPLRATGELTLDGQAHSLSREATAILDIHKAHYPRHMHWKWATFSGLDEAGRWVALNLTHNIIEDDRTHHENALWVDGELMPLSPARFTIPDDRSEPWSVKTLDGEVELAFHPEGFRSEDLNLGIIRSAFHQGYGTFRGRITGSDNHRIEAGWGLCEDHAATW